MERMPLSPKIAGAARRVNPYMLKVSGRVPPWATLHHVGGVSGRPYRTPIVAFAARAPHDPPSEGNPVTPASARDVLVVTPLPWGSDADWFKNVQAAGSATLTRKGVDYRVDQVRVVGPEEAEGLLGPRGRAMVQGLRTTEFMVGRLHPA
jgi:hypothetical protein